MTETDEVPIRLMASCPRRTATHTEELRVTIRDYEGSRYFDIRVWRRIPKAGKSKEFGWVETSKGISVREGEALAVASALQKGLPIVCSENRQRRHSTKLKPRPISTPPSLSPRSVPDVRTIDEEIRAMMPPWESI